MSSDRHRSSRRLPIKCAALLSSLIWSMAAFGAPSDNSLHCTPIVQYSCGNEKCERKTEGFQHAESFGFDFDTGILTACLWANCYSAKGQIFRSTDGKEMTIIGQLLPENMPNSYSPILVSMSVDTTRNFVAVWQFSGQELAFDLGRCAN